MRHYILVLCDFRRTYLFKRLICTNYHNATKAKISGKWPRVNSWDSITEHINFKNMRYRNESLSGDYWAYTYKYEDCLFLSGDLKF
jgi:hypothetical protein